MIKKFLKFVEIQTKVASVLPFLMGTLMAAYSGVELDAINALLMLTALLLVDMGTTGLNHYMDYQKAELKEGYHYEVHNPMGAGELSVKNAQLVLYALFGLAVIIGLVLFVRTDYIVLLLGAASFGVGMLYSLGPLPISRTILGEVFSGSFMGGIIPFLAFYIHSYSKQPIRVHLQGGWLTVALAHQVLLPIAWLCVPFVLLIANIMLANNICDREEDIVNKRHTLPVAIGRQAAVKLYIGNVIAAYAVVLIGVLCGVLPTVLLGVFVLTPIVYRQTERFVKAPVKGKTFVLAVKNFVMTATVVNILLFVGVLVNEWIELGV
ncbi:UbiA family prenyltransferase [Fusibacter sp. JL298sf-3]